VVTGSGQTLKISVQQKAPNKTTVTLTLPNGNMQRFGDDGSVAWAAAGAHVQQLEGLELAAIRLGAGFFHDMKLKGQCARAFALPRKEPINGRDANVVRCQLPGNQVLETFYFESESGLLLRRTTMFRTALGSIPQQADYSDYREVEGVKIAFTVRQARADSLSTRTWTDVRFNVPVNDTDFVMPKPAESKPPGQ